MSTRSGGHDEPNEELARVQATAREHLHLVERFTRVAPDELHYEFTVSDPTVWTAPWTALLQWSRTEEPIFEYACHEGNIGMEGILAGARADEAKAAGGR